MKRVSRKVENSKKFMKQFKQALMQWGAPAIALVLPVFASAQIQQPPITATTPFSNISQISGNTGIFCVAINWIFWLLIILTIIFVLIAAFRYLTAAGEPEKVKEAGNTLLYAAVAVVVGLLAKGLPYIVSTFFGANLGATC